MHLFIGHEQRVAGMHQPGGMLTVAHQIRNIVDHRDFRVDHRVPTAHAADRQTVDGELLARMHRRQAPPSWAAVAGIGVQRRTRIGLHQRRQPLGVGVVGMLMRDQDRRQPGDALEPVGEVPGIEQDGGRRMVHGAWKTCQQA